MLSPKQKVSVKRPCPACGKPDWCFFSGDGQSVVCARVQSDRRAGEAGWLHSLSAPMPQFYSAPREDHPAKDFETIWQRLADRTPTGFAPYQADLLGVSADALSAIGCAEYHEGVAAFPMKNDRGLIVGVRLRSRDARKWAIRGSQQGLFYGREPGERIIICEGPTDTAAMLSAGFDAIGRPSCRGCVDWTLAACRKRHVIILADADGPGRVGAYELADKMFRAARTLRIAEPLGFKDAREWLRASSRSEIECVLNNAEKYFPR